MLLEHPHSTDEEIETIVEMNYSKPQSYILAELRLEFRVDSYLIELSTATVVFKTFLAIKIFVEIKCYPTHYIKLLEVELL